jgi:NAD(P)-dependent dehydrogenase (short-subunit alcohol dehydrogenase family)
LAKTSTAIVTGGSRGIGLAVARYLAGQGTRVIVLARTAPPEIAGCSFQPVDFSDLTAARRIVDKVVAEHEVDILVNNLGMTILAPIEESTLAQLQQQMETNVHTMLACVQAVLPGMKARRYGRIVNIASRSALGRQGLTSYGASKAAVIGFTRGWALELVKTGITVNCVAPGSVETEMLARNFPPGSEARAKMLSLIPMERPADPREVAFAVAHFASREAGYTTGQVLYVCGGADIGLSPI